MELENASAELITAACAFLRKAPDLTPELVAGLKRNDPDDMRAAVGRLIEARRFEGLDDVLAGFRETRDFGVFARIAGAQLHRARGEFAAAVDDIEEVMARWPERTAAHWHVALARGLEGARRFEDAVAAAREGVARFPEAAPPRAHLANLLTRLNRHQEALQVWRDAHAAFVQPEMTWFLGLAASLKTLGRREEALTVLAEAGRRFAGDRRGPPLTAEVAQERGRWALALGIWETQAARFPDDAETHIGAARALFRLGRVEAALTRLDGVVARWPDELTAMRERARMALELGDATTARDLMRRLTRRFPERAGPEWFAALARAHHALREVAAAKETLAELERRFPESALGARERLRHARSLEHGLGETSALLEEALRRFPEDFELRAQNVWLLLARGRLDDAERAVKSLEAEDEAKVHALGARLKLEADRGDAAFRVYVERLAETHAFGVEDAPAFGVAMLEARARWAFALGEKVIDAVAGARAGQTWLAVLQIRLKIALQRDEEALALIDALPRAYVRRDLMELFAWAEARRGRDAQAKQIWAQSAAANYYAALHAPVQTLRRVSPDDRPDASAGPTAFVVFRNEAPQIASFLDHHRRLGVRRFVFFDHASTDEGRALALQERDVIVYDCPDSYQLSWSGRRWINEIVAREAAAGWGLQLDMDERLVYPGCETASLPHFLAYLEAHEYEAVAGYMLDMFAPRLVDDNGDAPPLSEHRWYDDSYQRFGIERPPYMRIGGGARGRLFEAREYLHKVPLWKLGAGQLISSHETTHLRFADVSAALLHYKLANVALRGREAALELSGAAFLEPDADVEAVRRHSRYVARLERVARRDLRGYLSREIEDSLGLTARGLMEMSPRYRRWLEGAGVT